MIPKLGKRKPLFLVGGVALIATGVIIFFIWQFRQAGSGKKSISSASNNQSSQNFQGLTSVLDTEAEKTGVSATDSNAQNDKARQLKGKNAAAVETVDGKAPGEGNLSSKKGGNPQNSDNRGLATNQLKDDKKEIRLSDSKKGNEESKKIVVDDENGPSDIAGKAPKPKNENGSITLDNSESQKPTTGNANTNASGNKPASNSEPLKPESSKGKGADADNSSSGTNQETPKEEDANKPEEQKDNQVDNTKKPESNDETPKPNADSDVVKAFKAAKVSFVEYLKKAILLSPDDTKINEAYSEVRKQLANVLKESPAFTDTENPIVPLPTHSLDMNEFVQRVFASEAFIQEYDKILSAECKQNVAEFEARFKVWLEWVKKFMITFPGRTTPNWITFTEYSEAKLWCINLNPADFTKTEQMVAEVSHAVKDKIVKFASETNSVASLFDRIQKAKSFQDVSSAISSTYTSEDFFVSAENEQVNIELNALHLKIIAQHFENSEDESVVMALNSLAEHVSGRKKLSSYECTEAWGTVILNVKDLNELVNFQKSVRSYSKLAFESQFPSKLFDNNVELTMLREQHREKTSALLPSRSTCDVLKKIVEFVEFKFRNVSPNDLSAYFKAVSLLFFDKRSLFYSLCPSKYRFDEVDAEELRQLYWNVLKMDVKARPQSFTSVLHWNDLSIFLETPAEIIESLKAENADPKVLESWIKFSVDYELILASGLKSDEAQHEKYFAAYRELKANFTKENLSRFLELISNGPGELKNEWISDLIGRNCEHSQMLVSDVIRVLWDIKNPEKVATAVMKIKSAEENKMLNFFSSVAFKLPFLIKTLDNVDVISLMLTGDQVMHFSKTFSFTKTPQFEHFLNALTEFLSKLMNPKWENYKKTSDLRSVIRSVTRLPEYAPSIDFLRLNQQQESNLLKQYLFRETADIINTFKELAKVIDSSEVKNFMMAEAIAIEKKLA